MCMIVCLTVRLPPRSTCTDPLCPYSTLFGSLTGWQFGFLESLFVPLDSRQFGLGYGAVLAAAALLFFFTQGLAARGAVKGDVFVVGALGSIVALVSAFVLFPVLNILISAAGDGDGSYALGAFLARMADSRIWVIGRASCRERVCQYV